MRIIYWAKGERGARCLRALLEDGWDVDMVVTHPTDGKPAGVVADLARATGKDVIAPENPNAREVEELLRRRKADLFILGGYGKILKPNTIDIPRLMTINLHGGRLPDYRGSSPMNWSLINGEASFGLSIIQVDSGVDTGPILCMREFPIGPDATIVDLHAVANEQFPLMLLEVLAQLADDRLRPIPQDRTTGRYYPLRFPEDGMLFWDELTAVQVHNRIRALTAPYPCARCFLDGREVKLVRSELCSPPFFGEPGRIYRKRERGLLVCAKDRSLWITKAIFADNGESVYDSAARYEKFATIRGSLAAMMAKRP